MLYRILFYFLVYCLYYNLFEIDSEVWKFVGVRKLFVEILVLSFIESGEVVCWDLLMGVVVSC